MAKNKVVFGNQTLIDLTDTTAEAADVAAGEVFYDRGGNRTVGTGNYMEKVANPTADDILITDENGQAVDSGVKTTDLIHRFPSATQGNVAQFDDKGQVEDSGVGISDIATKTYVDTADTDLQTQLGDLTTLTTDVKTNLVDAINEVYEKSGEPFRVKQWANAMTVEIPVCTEDISNTAIPKMVFSIDATEGADYQIVGMIAYEVFDAASGGNRINCWPVCQFTGNSQKELSVRWMCAGTSRKTARRINAWVLLKHR